MRLMGYQPDMFVGDRDLEGDDKRIVHRVDDRHLFGLATGPPYLDECAGHPGIVTHTGGGAVTRICRSTLPALTADTAVGPSPETPGWGPLTLLRYAWTCPRVTSTVREAPDGSS